MDSPAPHWLTPPEGVTVHKVEFSLMGVLAPIPNYKIGDWVQYGGMLYRPAESGSTLLVHRTGEYASGGGRVWGEGWGNRVHQAHIWGDCNKGYLFYCS